MNNVEKAFNRGFYCACAIMLRQHDQPIMVESCLRENYITEAEIVECGIDNFDSEVLLQILEKIKKEKRDSEIVHGLKI